MGPRGGLCVQMSQSNDAYIDEKEQNRARQINLNSVTIILKYYVEKGMGGWGVWCDVVLLGVQHCNTRYSWRRRPPSHPHDARTQRIWRERERRRERKTPLKTDQMIRRPFIYIKRVKNPPGRLALHVHLKPLGAMAMHQLPNLSLASKLICF